ncbi:hypothetical protein [Pantoea piersonii]|uniref:hypothetical protein n=1 Tax=Pantoea piersonii TaxID=2364647 RepID=UPI002898B7D2|nr:hypothetical protein [Pantoea piersonii]
MAFQYDGYPMVGKLFASGLITQDGETLEEQVMQRIIVLGKVTATILDDEDPYRPTI